MSRCLVAVVWACLVASLSAGTVTVDFTPREDGLIAVPSFMSILGNTNGGMLSNLTSDPETLEYIALQFNAGDAPIQFTAMVTGTDIVLSPGCTVSMVSGAEQITCGAQSGQFGLSLTAPFIDDPLGPNFLGVMVDDIVITGADVSMDDMHWVPTQVPEPSSFALGALLVGLVGIKVRRTS